MYTCVPFDAVDTYVLTCSSGYGRHVCTHVSVFLIVRFVLRNHIAQKAIELAEEGDYSEVYRTPLFAVVSYPLIQCVGIFTSSSSIMSPSVILFIACPSSIHEGSQPFCLNLLGACRTSLWLEAPQSGQDTLAVATGHWFPRQFLILIP